MNLKKAFYLYCNINSPKHFGLTHQKLGMNFQQFRNFVKITRLIGGGLKETDISLIFVEICYVGTRAFYDHEQFGAALAAIANKKKLAYTEFLKYIFRVTDELMKHEIDNGNTLMIDLKKRSDPYQIALNKKMAGKIGGIRRVAPGAPMNNITSSLEKLVIKPSNDMINYSLNTNSNDSLTSHGSDNSLNSSTKSVKSTKKQIISSNSSSSSSSSTKTNNVREFSLTDFLKDREKEKTIENLNAQLAGKIKRNDNDDNDELKAGWDDKIGKHSILMTDSPETWGWA